MAVLGTGLEHEFRRQVYLCQGLGLDRIVEIVNEIRHVGSAEYFECENCHKQGSFFDGHVCTPGKPMKVEAIKRHHNRRRSWRTADRRSHAR